MCFRLGKPQTAWPVAYSPASITVSPLTRPTPLRPCVFSRTSRSGHRTRAPRPVPRVARQGRSTWSRSPRQLKMNSIAHSGFLGLTAGSGTLNPLPLNQVVTGDRPHATVLQHKGHFCFPFPSRLARLVRASLTWVNCTGSLSISSRYASCTRATKDHIANSTHASLLSQPGEDHIPSSSCFLACATALPFTHFFTDILSSLTSSFGSISFSPLSQPVCHPRSHPSYFAAHQPSVPLQALPF